MKIFQTRNGPSSIKDKLHRPRRKIGLLYQYEAEVRQPFQSDLTAEGMIEVRSAYVIRVNIHKARWDGSVCSDPLGFVDCQQSSRFKSDHCARGESKCYFMNLYASDPSLRLDRHQPTYGKVFDVQEPERGDIAILWGAYADRKSFPIGVWLIEDFRIDDAAYVLYGNPVDSVLFPDRTVGLDEVNKRQTRSIGTDMIRLLEPGAIRPVLDRFVVDLVQEEERRNPTVESSKALQGLRSVIDGLPDSDSGLTQRISIPTEVLRIFDDQETVVTITNAAERDDPGVVKAVADSDRRPESSHELVGVSIDDFPAELIRDYEIALKVSDLVILAGPSGVGKTQLAKVFAELNSARFELVPVRPDWRTNEDLLGYLPPFGGEFIFTRFSLFVKDAAAEWELALADNRTPQMFHVCLDEMNLARPEYYMAEVLSRMEMQGDLRVLQLYEATDDIGFPRQIALPPNLRIVGTVNNDDTTNPLSPKVLDRAVYLKCDQIDLVTFFGDRLPGNIVATLSELDATVKESGLRVAYRVAGQIERWLMAGTDAGIGTIASLDAAIDSLVLSKLRLQRSDPNHLETLERLRVLFSERLSADDVAFGRSLATVDRLRLSLERADFANGQFET